MTERPEVSVVITTYNRARVLPGAIERVLDQDVALSRYEIIVVDNNSTDATRQVVESFQARAANLRYIFEARQGISNGRNAGVRMAVAPLVAFTDDDVRVARDWIRTIVSIFASHPEVAGVGGKVLPDWSGAWPTWLTREHWSPLALMDHGEAPFYVNASRRICLITANAAYRRGVFDRVGLFSVDVHGAEDHELLLRLWRAGEQGLYWPRLTATAPIDPERMRRRYHRRWHRRHGRLLAVMRDDQLERSRLGCFLGVPAHVYRGLATDFARWVAALLRFRLDEAFSHETALWSQGGFVTARWREFLSPSRRPST